MDEGDGGGFGESGGDPLDQFHPNEAISAVVDEGFLGEEDDDYEDLYNDVNVGEGFLQSLRKDQEDEKVDPPNTMALAVPDPGVSIPGVGSGDPGDGGVGGEKKLEEVGGNDGVSRVSIKLEEDQNPGFARNEIGGKALNANPSGATGMSGSGGMRVELGRPPSKIIDFEEQTGNNNVGVQGLVQNTHAGPVGVAVNAVQGGFGNGNGSALGNGINNGRGGGTVLFVGDLHWWTTDAELEAELSKYGVVREVKFFDEKASGKSKGYCQVDFYDPGAAAACKDGLNGHVFNGRPCVVAFASSYSIKKMGDAQVNRNQQQMVQTFNSQPRRGPSDVGMKPATGNNISTGGNYQGGDNNRGFGRGNWGRGNSQGIGGRGPSGPMRNRSGNMGGRGIMGNGGNGFGQGIAGNPPMMHPQAMMGQGFDPSFGVPMGRMNNYGGFPSAPAPPFSGILSPFPPVGGVGLPGVAPHVNPAFFGRGMAMNGMGMMPTSGADNHNMGMWPDPSMSGWGAEDHGGRGGESSYGDEAVSDHQYGDASHDRGAWPTTGKEKDRSSERDWSASSDRRFKGDDREPAYDRDMSREKEVVYDNDWPERKHRDDRDISRDRDRERDRERSRDRDRDRDKDRYREDNTDRYGDHHRYRDREAEHYDERDRGRSSRPHSKSRLSQDDDQRPRSRDADYGKRRRMASE